MGSESNSCSYWLLHIIGMKISCSLCKATRKINFKQYNMNVIEVALMLQYERDNAGAIQLADI